MAKPKKSKESKNNLKNNCIYRKWWFWTIVLIFFAITFGFLFIENNDTKSILFSFCGIWGSMIATFLIGFIAAKQSEYYTFLSKKQSAIDAIKTEQLSFITSFNNIENIEKYVDLVMEAFFLDDDDFVNKLKCTIKHIDLCHSIETFYNQLSSYWYAPISIKDAQNNCKALLSFLHTDLDQDTLLNTKLDRAVEVIKALSNKYLSLLKKLRENNRAIIAEMQYLIRITSQAKSMHDLTAIENNLHKFNKEVFKNMYYTEGNSSTIKN